MKIYLAICLAKLDNYFKIEKKKILHTNEWARVFRKLPGSTTSIHEAVMYHVTGPASQINGNVWEYSISQYISQVSIWNIS